MWGVARWGEGRGRVVWGELGRRLLLLVEGGNQTRGATNTIAHNKA